MPLFLLAGGELVLLFVAARIAWWVLRTRGNEERAGSAPPAVYYPMPAPGAEVVWCSPQELAARRLRDEELTVRWAQRQAEFAQRDRRWRRFWIGFGVVLGLGVIAGCGLTARWISQVDDLWLIVAGGAVVAMAVLVGLACRSAGRC